MSVLSTRLDLTGEHEHDRLCYWDFTECRWVCRAPEAPLPAADPAEVALPEPAAVAR